MLTKQYIAHGVSAVLASSLLLVNCANAAPPNDKALRHAEGRILVEPAAGLSEEKLQKILDRFGARSKRKLQRLKVRVVEVPPQAEAAVARALSRNRSIAFAEVDELLEPVGFVNDPMSASQWHLPKMQAPAAWQYGDGSGVIVAVCDSGVYTDHPDLAGQVLPGWNTASNNTDSSDISGHGTKVAGTIAAATNNGIGVASTAPGAKILPVRVTNNTNGSAYTSDIAECIRWAADNGARVANASYSAAGSSTVASAASYMMSKGGVVTVSAGNYNTDDGYANSPSLFVVAATDSGDNKASYSSYGGYVDIAAPGSGIYTTNSGGSYSAVSGTSFSSPNTAAVAAIVMAANPSLNPTDVLAVIINTAEDLGVAEWDPYFGHGRVNALAAAELAANADTSDTTPPDTQFVNPVPGTTVTGDVSVEVRAIDGFGVERVEFLVGGTRIAETNSIASNGNYQFSWDSTLMVNGQYQLTAYAYDFAGNMGQVSATVNVYNENANDDTPPAVTITSPNGGSFDSRVTVSAHATDNESVMRIEIRGDNKLLCSGTSSASCTWNLRKVSDGTHTVTATAFDAAGNSGGASATFTKGSTSGDGSTDPAPGKGRGKKR